jgi:hypothetical protein
VTALDVLGGKYPEDVRAIARHNIERESGDDTTDALDRAQVEFVWLAEVDTWKRVKAQAAYSTQQVDPFDRADRPGKQPRPLDPTKEPATEKQVRYLCFLGVSQARAETMSKKQAGFLIGKLKMEQGR